MTVSAELGDRVWRVRPVGRIGAVGMTSVWLVLAAGITAGGGVAASVVVMVWCIVLVVGIAAWRSAFTPRVVMGANAVTIYNPLRQSSIGYDDIVAAQPGYYGLTIVGRDGRRVTAWAVQKSNAARWANQQTRADEVAQAIMNRVSSPT